MDPRQVIIDASYEGEIMIAAGVPWTDRFEQRKGEDVFIEILNPQAAFAKELTKQVKTTRSLLPVCNAHLSNSSFKLV
jgi:hypothetical protein